MPLSDEVSKQTIDVLLAGGLRVELSGPVLGHLEEMGDVELQEEIRKQAAMLGVEEKIGGDPVGNLKCGGLGRYYMEANFEGLFHRLRGLVNFLDRAEAETEKAMRTVEKLNEVQVDLSFAEKDRDWARVATAGAKLSDTIATLKTHMGKIAINDDDVEKLVESAPEAVDALPLHLFVDGAAGGAGVGRAATTHVSGSARVRGENGARLLGAHLDAAGNGVGGGHDDDDDDDDNDDAASTSSSSGGGYQVLPQEYKEGENDAPLLGYMPMGDGDDDNDDDDDGAPGAAGYAPIPMGMDDDDDDDDDDNGNGDNGNGDSGSSNGDGEGVDADAAEPASPALETNEGPKETETTEEEEEGAATDAPAPATSTPAAGTSGADSEAAETVGNEAESGKAA